MYLSGAKSLCDTGVQIEYTASVISQMCACRSKWCASPNAERSRQRIVLAAHDDKIRYTRETQTCTYLSLHVHDGDSVGAVAHNELLDVARQQVDAVHCDVTSGRPAQGLERARALGALHVPNLDRPVRTRAAETRTLVSVIRATSL